MKSSPKQTDYPIYSEGKLSERKQLFHLSLRNRLPALRQTPISESDTDSQNDERQAFPRHRSSRYPTMYTRFLDWGTPKSLLLRHCHSTPYPSRSSVLRIVA